MENNCVKGGENLTLSIERAIDRCIEEGVLKEFLIKRRAEVVKAVQLDYTFGRQIELERIDSHEEGFEEGQVLKEVALIRKKHDKGMNAKQISEILEVGIDEAENIVEYLLKYPDKEDIEIAKMICQEKVV